MIDNGEINVQQNENQLYMEEGTFSGYLTTGEKNQVLYH